MRSLLKQPGLCASLTNKSKNVIADDKEMTDSGGEGSFDDHAMFG